MGNFIAVIFGLAVGVFLSLGVIANIWDVQLKLCAQEHNIYSCEWVAVPEQKDQPQ